MVGEIFGICSYICVQHTCFFIFCRSRVQEAILHLCKAAMKVNAHWDWLCVVPLCHFLSRYCEPFGNPSEKSKEFGARADEFGYRNLQSKVQKG